MSDHYCCKRCGLRYDDCNCRKESLKKMHEEYYGHTPSDETLRIEGLYRRLESYRKEIGNLEYKLMDLYKENKELKQRIEEYELVKKKLKK